MNQISPGAQPPRSYVRMLVVFCLSLSFPATNAQEETDEDAAETSKAIVLKLDYRSNACAATMNG